MAKNCGNCQSSNVSWSFIEEKCLCPGDDVKQPVKLLEISSNNRNINAVRNTISSSEFRSDRNPGCTRSSQNGSEGAVDFEFKVCDSNSLLLDSALANFCENGSDTGAITVDVLNTNTYQIATGGADFATLGFCKGQVVEVSGFTNNENNGNKIVCDVTGDDGVNGSTLTVYTDAEDSDYPELAVEAGSGTEQLVVTSKVTKLGDYERTFTIQRQLGDDAFEIYKGVGVNSLSLSITPDSYITGSMDLLGFGNLELKQQSLGEIFEQENCCPSTADEVEIFLGCQKLCGITSLDFSLANNASQTKTVGDDCANCLKLGTADISGNIQGFFNDFTFQNYIDNVTELPLTVLVHNETRSEFISFVFPAVTFTTSNIDPVAGEPILQNLEFSAKVADDCATSFFVQRSFVPASVVRNRIEFVTDCADVDISTDSAADITRTYEFGDGTVATVTPASPSEAYNYVFAAGFGAGVNKTVSMYADEDSPISVLDLSANCISDIELCYLEYATDINLSDNDLSSVCVDNLSQLTSLDMSDNANLNNISLDRACAITNFNASNAALSELAVDGILKHLVECGQSGGTVDLTGGTSAAPSSNGQGYVTDLTANGWTVTTN